MSGKEQALAKQSQSIEEQATKFAKITTNEQQKAAVELLKVIRGAGTEIDKWCDPNIKKWHEGHRLALAQKKELRAPLTKAERLLKGAIAGYRSAQERKAAEARRKAEAEARAAAEAKKRAEAEELREQGDDDLAEIVEEMPVAIELPKERAPPPTEDGVSFRTTVKVEVVDKKAAVAYILENWELFNHWVDIPLKHPRQLAQQQREAFKFPGIKMLIEKSTVVK